MSQRTPDHTSGELFDSRLTVLPVMLPTETLYSWCARYHRLTGNRLAADTSQQLFGTSNAGRLHDLPSHLAAFVDRTHERFGTAGSLAMAHTLLGFYVPFKPADLIRQACKDMAGPSVARLKFQLGLQASRVGATHPLKACPECMADEVRKSGIAVWHLEHQWPSVWICRRHGRWLQQSTIKTKSFLNQQWLLPDDVPAERWLRVSDRVFPSRPLLQRMAEMTVDLMASPQAPFDSASLRFTYLAGVKRKGMLRVKGAVQLREVSEHFLARAKGLDLLPGFEFVERVHDADGGFVGGLLRTGRGHKHPVKHLLLMAALFEGWTDFNKTYSAMAADQKSSPEKPVTRIWPDDPRRREFAKLMKTPGSTVSDVARQLGLDLPVALYWARKDRIPYRSRPHAIRPEMERPLAEALSQGMTLRKAAEQIGVPNSAVSNFLNSHPEIRESWETARNQHARDVYRARLRQAIANHPGVTRTQLRVTPGSGYKWLYQYDRDWLLANLPSLWANQGAAETQT